MSDNLGRVLGERIAAYRETLVSTPLKRSLFSRYPWQHRIAHVHLADAIPTPITRLETADGSLWVKRDDLTSTFYGGNKVRKLEYVLAEVAERNCTPVVVGANASHQVLATSMFSQLLGIGCEVVLFPQPPTPGDTVVSEVLDGLGVPVYRASNRYALPLATARALITQGGRNERKCLIYPGGSSPHGNLGYVDCGLEIADAVLAGDCPEPDVVYTAFGTGGTAVGLAIGLTLGGLKSRVCAVRVADPVVSNRWHLKNEEWRTRRLLDSLDVRTQPSIGRISLVTDYLGDGYGHPLARADSAVDLARRSGLCVDQTYTAKALAAALDHQRRETSDVVMFLNTLSAVQPAGDPCPRD